MRYWHKLSQMIEICRLFDDLPEKTGNISIRIKDKIVITPKGIRFKDLTRDSLVTLPGENKSSEWQLHDEVYKARADINAIIHTHSKYATQAAHNNGLPGIQMAEFAPEGSIELATNTVKALGIDNVCLLRNHGVVALGYDLNEALINIRSIEQYATDYYQQIH